jgi:hypothetical protein
MHTKPNTYWPVAKRESNGADQEAHSLAKFGNKDITPLVLSCVMIA